MTADKILNKINDFLGYAGIDTTTERDQKISAINSALSFMLGEFDFENSTKTITLEFSEDQLVYSLPSDFVYLISLAYDNSAEPYISENNRRDWSYETPETLIKLGKKPSDAVLYSLEGNKIYILTKNVYPPLSIDKCENITGWSVLNDAVNLGTSSAFKKEGDKSIKFDIDVSNSALNRASLKRTFSPSLNLKTYENKGSFTLWLYIRQTTNLTSISFNWATDAANYYKATVTNQANGTPFIVGWNFLKFNWKDATIIGNPDPQNITYIQLDIDYNSSFTSSNNWFLDDIKVLVYDPIVVKYYTNLVVRDTSGSLKSSITATTDDVLIIQNELSLSLIALLSIQHYRGASTLDKTYINSLYQSYYTKVRNFYPPKRIFTRFGRVKPPLTR
jgi:hypothetical protein